ncbi:MAG: hypothetical protein JHD16_06240 [Solirubrobacteraceae bacterium]|nr:hypothetical protein [Solirubrobacteraceae bacterium]
MHSRSLKFTLIPALLAVAVVPPAADAARRSAPVDRVAPRTAPIVTTTATAAASVAVPVASATAAAAADTVTAAPIINEMTQACTDTPTFKAFQAFGDNADYAFAPGGSFENGAPGWSLDGASVVDDNDTSGVFGGNKALSIRDGGRVVSPWFCVTPANPHFRFVTYGGEVEMEIDYKVIGESDIDDDLVGETNGGRSWGPSEMHELATEIPSSKLAKGVLARVIFEAEDDIRVDNVLIDPYRRG